CRDLETAGTILYAGEFQCIDDHRVHDKLVLLLNDSFTRESLNRASLNLNVEKKTDSVIEWINSVL
ncbi:MAG: hypothetical protein KDD25_05020, partial [Bdellovibrionales bacterium]|nr:hypothetical protein [Bdellovibrionales bacterium]